jgi:hypothetical protein
MMPRVQAAGAVWGQNIGKELMNEIAQSISQSPNTQNH